MINGLKLHPAKTEAGLEWIGTLPAHWGVHRVKSLVSNVVERQSSPQQGDMHIALEHVESWTGRIKSGSEKTEPDSQWNCFQPGDVLFGKLRPYLAKVTRVAMSGRCVGEFLVLRPNCTGLDSRFLERLFRSKPFIDIVDSSTFGAKMPRAEWAFIGALKIGCPPLTEQSAIVRFLDHADQHIQRYIRAKEKQIALLEEQKQAVIHQAVTGKIDVRTGERYPVYRDSGVEWLKEVPDHWEIRRVRNLAQMRVSNVDKIAQDHEHAVRLCNYSDVYYNDRINADMPFMWATASSDEIARFRLQVGDVLITKDSEAWNDIGVPAYVESSADDLVSGYHLALLRPDPAQLNGAYLHRALSSSGVASQLYVRANGVTRYGLSQNAILSLRLPVPPVSEQVEIARFLNEALARLDAGMVAATRQIRLVQELRSRLTADVVTGKLDVREAASTLPGRQLTRNATSVHANP